MNQQELQRILLMPEGLRAQYLAALKKPQKMSDGGEFGRKAQRINQATSFGDVPMGGNQIIKDVGGNWLGGNVEQALQPLLTRGPTEADRKWLINHAKQNTEAAKTGLEAIPKNEAINKWVRGNLTNYVKKQMATKEDPVRKLAEQGISHFPIAEDPTYWARKGELSRKEAGGNLMSKSDLARQWENRSDAAINAETAQQHQNMMHLAPKMYTSAEDWIKKLPPETTLYNTRGRNFNPSDLGFDHIMDVLREDLAEGRIRPEQLSKISMEQAVRRVHEYDQDKLKKMKEAQIKNTEGMPVHKVYDDGHKWIELAMPKENPERLSEIGTILRAHRLGGEHGVDWLRGANGEKEYFVTKGNGRNTMYLEKFPTEEEAIARGKELAGQKIDVDSLEEEREGLTKEAREQKLAAALKYEGDTMGHCVGGYCPDVMEGRSRIFSLRDAKGEPHVTVETEPSSFHPIGTNTKGTEFPSEITYGNKFIPISIPEEKKQAIYNLAKKLFEQQGGQPHARLQEAADAIIGKAPDRIVQIKGKGNAKPVAKYIPMVQDFVKSHNWGGVEDLHHTDLIHLDPNSDLAQAIQASGEKPPRYITQQELTDLSKKHSFPTWVNNVQKKAKGGSIKPVGYTKEKVTVSPSLDRMQYELMSVKHFKKAK